MSNDFAVLNELKRLSPDEFDAELAKILSEKMEVIQVPESTKKSKSTKSKSTKLRKG